MTRHVVRTLCVGLLVASAGCVETDRTFPQPPSLDAELRQSLQQWGIVAINPQPAQDPSLVVLGQALFFDKELSGNRDIACATCHNPPTAMGDGQSLAVGTGGTGIGPARTLGPGRQFVPRNAPTLMNVALGLSYAFWDGRVSGFSGFFQTPADTALPAGLPNILAAQAMFPVTNRTEMRGEPGDTDVFGNPNELAQYTDSQWADIWRAVMLRLLAFQAYKAKFAAAFPAVPVNQLGFQHAAIAIAAFETQALTKIDTPFDRYLRRNDDAMSQEEKRGALLFFGKATCSSCHNGPQLGAGNFVNVGVPQIGPGVGPELPLDLGRGALPNNEFYRFAFRVAPLRNVELTAPYFHDGAYPTLDAVVQHYNDVRLALPGYDTTQLTPDVLATYHGDPVTIASVLERLDFRLQQPLKLTETERSELVAFLKALTDPSARNLSALVPSAVPSGLPVP
ncbi:MAG: cytochrome-c peroxidase [Gemmatimonadales bacterium]